MNYIKRELLDMRPITENIQEVSAKTKTSSTSSYRLERTMKIDKGSETLIFVSTML